MLSLFGLDLDLYLVFDFDCCADDQKNDVRASLLRYFFVSLALSLSLLGSAVADDISVFMPFKRLMDLALVVGAAGLKSPNSRMFLTWMRHPCLFAVCLQSACHVVVAGASIRRSPSCWFVYIMYTVFFTILESSMRR